MKSLGKRAISRMLAAIVVIIIVIIAIVAVALVYYLPGPAAAGLSVTLNSPNDDATVSLNTTTFTYTPVSIGDDIENASLWINGTMRLSNSTNVLNNTSNSFTYTFDTQATYIWTVQVWNSTNWVTATNRTLIYKFVTGTVTVWHGLLPNELTVWDNRTAVFEAQYPGITVNLVEKTSLHDDLATAVVAGIGPDLYTWGAEDWQGEFAQAGIIVPIDSYFDSSVTSQFYASAIQAMTYNGSLWALPISAECITLFYNKAFITTPPTTTDEMVALMQNESSKGGTAPYQYGLVQPVLNDPYHLYPWVSGWGGYYFNDTTQLLGLNSTGTVQAATWFNSTILPYLASDLTGSSQLALFEQNKSAMMISGPWEVSNVQNANITFGLSLIPSISDNGDSRPMPFEGVKGIWMTSNVQPANLEADTVFMQWWTGVDNQKALGEALGYIPVAPAAYTDPIIQNDAVISGFGNQLQYTIGIPVSPQMSSDVWTGATNAWNAVVQQLQTPQVAFQQAQDATITGIITKYGHYP